jgi:hypothetical protein
MAKWDFKIVGASFVKELVPVLGDSNPRSQSFMQPSFDLEGDKIVMKESGQYKTAIYFSQIGEIDGVAPTDIDDAYAKLLVLVENFNGGGGAPGTTPSLQQVLTVGDRIFKLKSAPYTIEAEDIYSYVAMQEASPGDGTIITIDNDIFNKVNGVCLFSVFQGDGVIQFSGVGTIANNGVEGLTTLAYNQGDVISIKYVGAEVYYVDIVNKSSGGGTWGSITGTLSSQTDLQTALDAKQDDLTAANMHTYVDGLTALTTPVDADRMIIVDNSASLAKKITWANIKATLKTYFDGFYSSKQPGSFSGTFALDALGGNFYNDLTQVGALTFAAGGSAIVGGSDCVKITANGSAITIPGTFINVGGESISIVNGAINRITVMKTASEIWYTVKVN